MILGSPRQHESLRPHTRIPSVCLLSTETMEQDTSAQLLESENEELYRVYSMNGPLLRVDPALWTAAPTSHPDASEAYE